MDIDDTLEIDIENKYINDKEKTKFTIEEAIYILKRKNFCDEVENIAIQTLLSELEKKDKIIDLMAEELADCYMDNLINNRKIDKQYVINKFINKLEESEK